jgi:hypothetical protein
MLRIYTLYDSLHLFRRDQASKSSRKDTLNDFYVAVKLQNKFCNVV